MLRPAEKLLLYLKMPGGHSEVGELIKNKRDDKHGLIIIPSSLPHTNTHAHHSPSQERNPKRKQL
jgi:hypothetical protein